MDILFLVSDLDCKNTEGMRDTIECTVYFDYRIVNNRLEINPVCNCITFDQTWWNADIDEMARVGVEGCIVIVRTDTLEITRYDLDAETILMAPCAVVMSGDHYEY